jgi:hypothetical protein
MSHPVNPLSYHKNLEKKKHLNFVPLKHSFYNIMLRNKEIVAKKLAFYLNKMLYSRAYRTHRLYVTEIHHKKQMLSSFHIDGTILNFFAYKQFNYTYNKPERFRKKKRPVIEQRVALGIMEQLPQLLLKQSKIKKFKTPTIKFASKFHNKILTRLVYKFMSLDDNLKKSMTEKYQFARRWQDLPFRMQNLSNQFILYFFNKRWIQFDLVFNYISLYLQTCLYRYIYSFIGKMI